LANGIKYYLELRVVLLLQSRKFAGQVGVANNQFTAGWHFPRAWDAKNMAVMAVASRPKRLIPARRE
jgi:hypothetical protein